MRKTDGYMPLVWDSEPEFEACRGHVSPEFFDAEVSSQGVVSRGSLGPSCHAFARLIPRVGRDYDQEIRIETAWSSGCFKVTVAYQVEELPK